MTRGIYVSATTPGSGKTLVALGLADALHRHADRIGFFRPITAGTDPAGPHGRPDRRLFELDAGGVPRRPDRRRGPGAAGRGQPGGDRCPLRGDLQPRSPRHCDVVIVEGTDLTGQDAAVEFDLNARLANNLGCPVRRRGRREGPDRRRKRPTPSRWPARNWLRRALHAAGHHGQPGRPGRPGRRSTPPCRPGASGRPVYVFPELEEIARPTTGEVAAALGLGQVAGCRTWNATCTPSRWRP